MMSNVAMAGLHEPTALEPLLHLQHGQQNIAWTPQRFQRPTIPR
jgi:hypothetical protein